MEDINRKKFIQLCMYTSAGLFAGYFFGFSKNEVDVTNLSFENLEKFDWGYVIDTTRCIGCGACVRACKVENEVKDTYFRTWVERYEINGKEVVRVDSPNGALSSFSHDNFDSDIVKAFFVPKICNHCYNSACTQVCPVGASYHSPDKVVLIDKDHCVGCGYCVQACPYACRYIDHEVGTADKCTLCYHRIHQGLEPACVDACPREVRIFGNLKDPDSEIRKILHERRFGILKPEMGTDPKCYYVGLDMEVK